MNPFTIGQWVAVGPQAYKPGRLLGVRGTIQRVVGEFCIVDIPKYGTVAFLAKELVPADDESASSFS